jgi:hypothetical protein
MKRDISKDVIAENQLVKRSIVNVFRLVLDVLISVNVKLVKIKKLMVNLLESVAIRRLKWYSK